MNLPIRGTDTPGSDINYLDDEQGETCGTIAQKNWSIRDGPPGIASWYWCGKASTVIRGHDGVAELISYDHRLLVTVRALFVRQGTILKKRVLWVEELITLGIYGLAVLITVAGQYMDHALKENMKVQTHSLLHFCSVLTTIAIFLMGTFTILNFNRWQKMRNHGVESIWSAASSLQLIISTNCTRDDRILSAIDRYARASLMLLFMANRNQTTADDLELLRKRGVLTHDEIQKLAPAQDGMMACMAIWTWTAQIIQGLHQKGLVKSDPLLRFLINKCYQGQAAAREIVTMLTAQIPMGYFTLVSWMVKIHNVLYAVVFGSCAVVQIETQGPATFTICLARILILTVLFHALLILNQELANPFSGKAKDASFPMAWLGRSMKKDMSNYEKLADNLPDWCVACGIGKKPAVVGDPNVRRRTSSRSRTMSPSPMQKTGAPVSPPAMGLRSAPPRAAAPTSPPRAQFLTLPQGTEAPMLPPAAGITSAPPQAAVPMSPPGGARVIGVLPSPLRAGGK